MKNGPQEDLRLQVQPIFLNETIRCMQEAVYGRPTDPVFSLGEVEISEWQDHKPKKIMVPSRSQVKLSPLGISRKLKQITAITRVFAGEACLVPYMVKSQAIEPV
jgi:hypothetical protein